MKLAYKESNKITIRNYKSIPKIGVISFGDIIDWKLLNESNYFEVSEDSTYDPIMQHLGAYEIIDDKAVRQVINNDFGTIEYEKKKKIKEAKSFCNSELSSTDWYITREAETGIKTPQEIKDIRAFLRDECNRKEAEINALTELREVVSYE